MSITSAWHFDAASLHRLNAWQEFSVLKIENHEQQDHVAGEYGQIFVRKLFHQQSQAGGNLTHLGTREKLSIC